jgi:flagellar protein FlbD
MITLHRLGHAVEPFKLNPDLIVTVEANPDTVITLTTGSKIVVAEPPERVCADMHHHRVEVLAEAMQRRHELQTGTGQPRGRATGCVSPANAAMLHVASIEADGS